MIIHTYLSRIVLVRFACFHGIIYNTVFNRLLSTTMENNPDPIKWKLLKLKYGAECKKLVRDQLRCVLDLCKFLRPDYQFPCVETLERWGDGTVTNFYKSVDVGGYDLTFIKPSMLLQLYWANPILRLALVLKCDNILSVYHSLALVFECLRACVRACVCACR